MTNHITQAGRLIAQNDPDRYFLSLFAPEESRKDLWSIMAFYYETARTREMVTDTTMGLIRLQWWKDAIKNFYDSGAIAPHEIFDDLTQMIQKHDIQKYFFDNMLTAREFDVEDKIPTSIMGLKNYIQFTHTPFLKIACKIINADLSDGEIQSLSFAYAAVGLMRAFVYHAQARRCYIPIEGVITPEDVFAFKNMDKLKPIVEQICNEVRLSLGKVSSKTPMVKAMRALTQLYLKQIEHANYNLIAPALAQPPKFKQLRVWLSVLFG